MAKKKYKKPNFFVFNFFKLCCRFMAKFVYHYKAGINELKGKKGPYLLLSNHEFKLDFMNLYPLVPGRSHMVISYSFYKTSKIRKIMDICGLIPKQQFQTTPKEMKQMKNVIRNNMPLILFPVGLMTENGMSTNPGESTAGLIKFLDTDVYISKIRGGYLTKPKWSNILRKGKIKIDIVKLYDKEQIKELPLEEIYKTICEELKYNSYDYQEQHMIKHKHGENVEGLNYVLYQCPDCNKEYSITANKDTLKCNNCGYEVKADKYGMLNLIKGNNFYKKPSDWYLNMQQNVTNHILKEPDYTFKSSGKIHMIDAKTSKFNEVGEGLLYLNKENIILEATINNEPTKLELVTSTYPLLPFQPGRHIELQNGMDIYRIIFDNPYDASKFNMYLKEFNNNKN